jgi:hypothetical protein
MRHHEVKDVRRDADHVVQDEPNVTQVEHNVMQVKSTQHSNEQREKTRQIQSQL